MASNQLKLMQNLCIGILLVLCILAQSTGWNVLPKHKGFCQEQKPKLTDSCKMLGRENYDVYKFTFHEDFFIPNLLYDISNSVMLAGLLVMIVLQYYNSQIKKVVIIFIGASVVCSLIGSCLYVDLQHKEGLKNVRKMHQECKGDKKHEIGTKTCSFIEAYKLFAESCLTLAIIQVSICFVFMLIVYTKQMEQPLKSQDQLLPQKNEENQEQNPIAAEKGSSTAQHYKVANLTEKQQIQ